LVTIGRLLVWLILLILLFVLLLILLLILILKIRRRGTLALLPHHSWRRAILFSWRHAGLSSGHHARRESWRRPTLFSLKSLFESLGSKIPFRSEPLWGAHLVELLLLVLRE